MVPLLFAAAIALSPAQAAPPKFVHLGPDTTAACAALAQLTVAPDGTPMLYKLTELPPGIAEHAVWRTVSGCPVREVVYKGQAYYMGSSIPTLDNRPLQGNRMRHYPAQSPDAPDGR